MKPGRFVLVAVAGLMALPTGRTQPASVEDRTPLVIVSSDRSGEPRLYAFTPDGRRAVRLTRGEFWTPAVSPDGRLIAVHDFDVGEGHGYLIRSDGRSRTRLPGRGVFDAAWSDDGALVAYKGDVVDGPISVADRNASRRGVYGDEADVPRWVPGTHTLVYADGDQLVAVDVRPGGERRVLADDAVPSLGGTPVSRAGRIAYASDGGVSLRDVDGTLVGVIDAADVFDLAWSPDGRFLAIETVDDLLLTRADGRVVRRIRGLFTWSWTPGAQIVTITRFGRFGTIDVATGARTPLLDHVQRTDVGLPTWSLSRPGMAAYTAVRLSRRGSDVYVYDGRRVRRVTTPFPDGGSNRVVGWGVGELPRLRPAPRVHPVRATAAVARSRVLSLEAAETGAVAVTSADKWACGRIELLQSHVTLDACRGESAVGSVAANRRVAAWTLLHEDEGIGDDPGVCLHLRAFGTTATARERRTPCDPSDPPPSDRVAAVYGGSIDRVRAVGDAFAAVVPRWDRRERRTRYDLVRFTLSGVTAIVGSAVPLTLLDADAERVVVRRGASTLVIHRAADGAVLRTLAFPRRSVVDGAISGSILTVLRANPDRIEAYDIGSRRRLRTIRIARGFGPPPLLADAAGQSAAYIEGIVPHLVRFDRGSDTALDVRGAVDPVDAAFVDGSLVLSYHRETPRLRGVIVRTRRG